MTQGHGLDTRAGKGPSSQEAPQLENLLRSANRDRWILLLAAVVLACGWAAGLFWVGADTDQGQVYRIIYVHVPVAWNSFLWVIAGAVFASWGLARRKSLPALDLSSQAAVEVGTIFAALSLVTGMIWGRPTWGVWWDWDPRLVSTLVMFLVCMGYHLLRSFTPDARARRVVAAGVALLAALNVPIVYYSVNIWRSIHQPQTFTRSQSSASSDVVATLVFNVFAMMVLGYALYRVRRGGLSLSHALEQARQDRG